LMGGWVGPRAGLVPVADENTSKSILLPEVETWESSGLLSHYTD